MKKKLWIFTLFLPAIISGCGPAPALTQSAPPAFDELLWVIASDTGTLPDYLNDYAIYSDILTELKLRVKIRVWNGNLETRISQSIVSGSLPDLATFYADENACKRFEGMGAAADVKTLDDALYQNIPRAVLDYHTRAGQLLYLPGGYNRIPGDMISSEGIFVRKTFLENGLISRTPDTQSFIQSLTDICQWYRKANNRVDDIGAVVLDAEPNGWTVLEHLFALDTPADYSKETHTKLLSMVRFMADLGHSDSGFYKDNMIKRYQEDGLKLDDRSHVFIGRKRVMEQYNETNPQNAFEQIYPRFSTRGFLCSDSLTGRFKTYILNRHLPANAIKLLQYLQSEQGSYLSLLGAKDVDWIMDGETPTAFLSTRENMKNALFRSQTGIAQFLFLSTRGIVYPSAQQTGEPITLQNPPVSLLSYEEKLLETNRLEQLHTILQEAFLIGGDQGYLSGKNRLENWRS